jgi:aspartyl-tRNA(Asn)/glutamyl-tRNA(Gln) amidotransferase subunit C
MSLTQQDVARIAKLARIAVTEEEIEAVGQQLNTIFGLIEKMQAVNTDNVEPMAHPQDVALRLRADAVTETDQRERFLSIAPQTQAGLFLVPKVIE